MFDYGKNQAKLIFQLSVSPSNLGAIVNPTGLERRNQKRAEVLPHCSSLFLYTLLHLLLALEKPSL